MKNIVGILAILAIVIIGFYLFRQKTTDTPAPSTETQVTQPEAEQPQTPAPEIVEEQPAAETQTPQEEPNDESERLAWESDIATHLWEFIDQSALTMKNYTTAINGRDILIEMDEDGINGAFDQLAMITSIAYFGETADHRFSQKSIDLEIKVGQEQVFKKSYTQASALEELATYGNGADVPIPEIP